MRSAFLLILNYYTSCFDYCQPTAHHAFCNASCTTSPNLCDMTIGNNKFDHKHSQVSITRNHITHMVNSLNQMRSEAMFHTLAFDFSNVKHKKLKQAHSMNRLVCINCFSLIVKAY